jgi:hypothetical protein
VLNTFIFDTNNSCKKPNIDCHVALAVFVTYSLTHARYKKNQINWVDISISVMLHPGKIMTLDTRIKIG